MIVHSHKTIARKEWEYRHGSGIIPAAHGNTRVVNNSIPLPISVRDQ